MSNNIPAHYGNRQFSYMKNTQPTSVHLPMTKEPHKKTLHNVGRAVGLLTRVLQQKGLTQQKHSIFH